MSKITKLTALSLSMIMGTSIISNGVMGVHAAEAPNMIGTKNEGGFTYDLIKDDENQRIIQYAEDKSEVTIIFNKKNNSLSVTRTVDGISTTEEIKTPSIMTRGNSSMFSPWKYSNKGNKYKLTAVINGKTVSKTRTKNSSTSANIARFSDAVDDIRSAEWSIIIAVGPSAAGGLIFAALTGGLGLPAALAAIGASASALAAGKDMNTYYNRAKSAYNAL